MRALFLLHGAPGTGKSTLMHKLGVKHLTLSYDQTRELFSASYPCVDADGREGLSLRMSAETERAVVTVTKEALKARLAAGTTVFFDSVMDTASYQNDMIKLARSYGYQVHLIDCQGETSVEELLERNRARGIKRVSDEVVEAKHAACAARPRSEQLASVIDGTAPVDQVMAQIHALTQMKTISADRVVVVGDVHSCAEALASLVERLDEPGTHWVFAGDLFDRGPDALGVWNIVHELIAQGRGTVVTGNHELNLRAINTGVATARFGDTRATRDALLEGGIMAGEQIAFVNQTVPALGVLTATRTWFVTHGGVGFETATKLFSNDGLLEVSDAECVYGMSTRADTYRGKTSYGVGDIALDGYQLHGHRNSRVGQEPVEVVRLSADRQPIVCLEAGASAGGHIRAAVLEAGGFNIEEVADGVSPELAALNTMLPWDRPKKSTVPGPAELVQRMRASEHVNVKQIESLPGVVACNFTRRAFHDGAWNELTMHARGLFVDESANKIVARGYEKFFHIGEAPGRDHAQWTNTAVTRYPVTLHKKYNGYLALVSSLDGKLTVFSKSGITAYSRFAEQLLLSMLGDKHAQLAQMLENTNTTAVFEVIARNDTHPITEPGPDRLVLLDCIKNEVEFSTNDAIRTRISRRFGIEVAETVAVAKTPAELAAALIPAIHNRTDEGVVVIDRDGYRSKVKAALYSERKSARTALERVWRGAAVTLGPRFAELETRLAQAGIWNMLPSYTVIGVDGQPRLDLARVFDDLENAV